MKIANRLKPLNKLKAVAFFVVVGCSQVFVCGRGLSAVVYKNVFKFFHARVFEEYLYLLLLGDQSEAVVCIPDLHVCCICQER